MLARSLLYLVQPGLTYGTLSNQNNLSTRLIGDHHHGIAGVPGSHDLSVQDSSPVTLLRRAGAVPVYVAVADLCA